MAKFVGKVFRIPDRYLGIKGHGTHYVKISWFDPREKIFHGKIITSLEEHLPKSSMTPNDFRYRSHKRINNDLFAVVNNKKITDMRDGKIVPIPVSNAKGLERWSGYSGERLFDRTFLSRFIPTDIQIKK